MAKKKKRREEKSKKFPYMTELYGLAFILLAVLGIGMNKPLGLVGRLARSFAVFLVGSWDVVFLAACFVVGGYLLLKREVPKFFTTRLVGIYILAIGILVFSHLSYIKLNEGESIIIFQETLNSLMANFDAIMRGSGFTPSGGGLLGCTLAVLFDMLFDYSGTKIVAIILMVAGGCLFTGISIIDVIKSGLKKGKNMLPHHRHGDDDGEEEPIEPAVVINDNTDNKMVISSIEELTHKEQEMPKEEDQETVIDNKVVVNDGTSNEVVSNMRWRFKVVLS